jgi:alkanesulfonate monooxygenase SsuD/methylene tetrahydromethanopterin reductase-like flavin-dependent oxidoreductase (luciferase family)
MEYGAHLPLIDFGGGAPKLAELREYTRRAGALGFRWLCANDHLLFQRPWLDGPTALAATLGDSGEMTLATTVLLPVIRGPVQSAKLLAAIHGLSGGRLVAGLGPGSSARDYEAAGVPFEERWPRFDDSIGALRSQLPDGPPLWIASWGSPAGLRRVARLGDGWLASGYNTTPARFGDARAALADELRRSGRDADRFPNAIATMWLHVTESRREVERVLDTVLAPALGRPIEQVRALDLPIGSAEQCAERLDAYARAGAQRIFVWPLTDELRQLQLLRERVAPLVGTPA